ncbi:MAG TPA: T6SS immunity protein Tli4 family protein [Smithellaceae bacterium]|nr:T6SS immunity protein Tli4 family protein [Smithellaceae bacterium]
MMRKLSQLLIAVMISLMLCGFSDAAEGRSLLKPTGTTKGAKQGMKTYYMGRFAIDLPADFKLEIQSQKIRYAEVSDFKWKERDRAKERESLWEQKLAKMKKLQLPKGRKQIIIEEKHLKGIGSWAKAVEYYGDYRIGDYIYWTVLVDYGESGLWLTLYGLNNHKSLKNFNNILTHYQYGFDNLTKDAFCLNHGRIELPYLEHERTYARFAGPMGMKLEIDMNETHQVEEVGLLDSFTASLAMNFAPGVDVDKIRARKRTIGELQGEELLTRMTANRGPKLYFGWKYLGKEDSGENPEIDITVEDCPDSNLDEKIRLWDRALDSFRPAYKH